MAGTNRSRRPGEKHGTRAFSRAASRASSRRRGCGEETAWSPLMGNTSKAERRVRQVPLSRHVLFPLCRRGDDRSPQAEEGTGLPGSRVQAVPLSSCPGAAVFVI